MHDLAQAIVNAKTELMEEIRERFRREGKLCDDEVFDVIADLEKRLNSTLHTLSEGQKEAVMDLICEQVKTRRHGNQTPYKWRLMHLASYIQGCR